MFELELNSVQVSCKCDAVLNCVALFLIKMRLDTWVLQRLTYSRAWVRLSEILSKKEMMMQFNWSRFYFSAPYYFGFRKTDAVGGA